MKREDVEALRQLLAKATPGPWLYRGKSNTWHKPPPEGTQYSYGESIMDDDEDYPVMKDDDIDLIAAAINALPALLDIAEAVIGAAVANAKLDVFRAACEDEPDAHGLRMTIGNQTFQIGGGPGFDSRDDAEWMAGQLRHALGRLVRVGGGA